MSASLHERVRRTIEQRVSAGHYRPGSALPSAATLATEFEVSAITIKRALRDLQTSGVLRSVAGLGTFVRERRRFVRDLDFSFNSLEDAARLGLGTTIDLISVSLERISDPVLVDFAGIEDEPMTCVRKVILADGEMIMHDTTYISLSPDNEIVGSFSQMLVVQAFQERGIEFTRSRLMIDAAPSSKEISDTFSVPTGYPVLRRLYKLTTTKPDLLVLGIAQSPFDRLACTTEIDLTRRTRKITKA